MLSLEISNKWIVEELCSLTENTFVISCLCTYEYILSVDGAFFPKQRQHSKAVLTLRTSNVQQINSICANDNM